MSKQKPNKRRDENVTPASEKKRAGVPLRLWLPEDVGAAFKNYLDSFKYKPTVTNAITEILRDLLREEGFYPPSRRSIQGDDD